MGIGKYSPTLTNSYMMDRQWWERNGGGFGNGLNPDSDDDNDGYDSYGYSNEGSGPDRAGYTENEYLSDSKYNHNTESFECYLLEDVERDYRNVLLGDLNDYISIYGIIKDNKNMDFDKFKLYKTLIMNDNISSGPDGSPLSSDLLRKDYVHKDKVNDFIKEYKKYIKPESKNEFVL